METAKKNLFINQGANFTVSVQVFESGNTAANTDGYVGQAQMRKHYSSNTFYEFVVSTGANGAVTLTMSANTTTSIDPGRYVYDVELTANTGDVYRVLQGLVTVDPEVTR